MNRIVGCMLGDSKLTCMLAVGTEAVEQLMICI